VLTSVQRAALDQLADRTARAMAYCRQHEPSVRALVVCGGVAANQALRARLQVLCERHGLRLLCPPPKHCTDNGVMIAWAAMARIRNMETIVADELIDVRSRWPLDSRPPPDLSEF
jgi:N6-L-threonylcarbamoyladenine synthase